MARDQPGDRVGPVGGADGPGNHAARLAELGHHPGEVTRRVIADPPEHQLEHGVEESQQARRSEQVNQILASLDDREQKIIISRFGLDYSKEPQTLKEVGAQLGVTKERIRQIEARALNKLRAAAKEENIELPEGMLETEN